MILKLTKLVKTCFACPAQWEGETTNKEYVYIRYRYGVLSVSVNKELVLSIEYGDDMNGYMETEKLLEILEENGIILTK